MWPAMIVQKLFPQLPDGFAAAPGVHLGTAFEMDASAYEKDDPTAAPMPGGSGGVALVTHAALEPTLTLETDWVDQDEYEVRIYDDRLDRRLVAAIELIQPVQQGSVPRAGAPSSARSRPYCNATFVCHWSMSSRYGTSISMRASSNPSRRHRSCHDGENRPACLR